ncbi:MAG: hypothetical protein PHE88_03630 [Elusimicrobia bacterium]|nr:hypothetical protein [Elusimicrobiota bacterium]
MTLLKYFIFILFTTFLLLNNTILNSKSVYQKQINNREIEIELDPYSSCIDYYLPLMGTPIQYFDDENEISVYKKLVPSPLPRFLMFELSIYPVPSLGTLVKKQFPQFYDSLDVADSFNIIKSVSAGFEEPYAVSIFLGNVVSFRFEGKKDVEGKGYSGLFVSGGNYYIKDNELIEDNWIASEIKVKGYKIKPEGDMDWSFRIGSKFNDNQYIKDVFYFSLQRDRTDYISNSSLFKNSIFEYTLYFDTKSSNLISQLFVVGKKFPLKNRKMVFSISTGFFWEKSDKYTGPLKRTDISDNLQILFRPNIEF